MIDFQPGELILIAFPFTGSTQSKNRPAMIVLDTGDADILVARVTTQNVQSDHDLPIGDWKGAGLLAPSTIRLHKLATLQKSLVQRRLGCIQIADRAAVAAALRRIYENW